MFEHDGIVLRKTGAADLFRLLQLRNEAWRSFHRTILINDSDQKKWFDELPCDVLHLSAENDGKQIGFFQWSRIDWINRSATATWGLFFECRGKGLGYKLVKAGCNFAVEVLNLQRLDAEILRGNIASQKCAIAAGFAEEGCRRAAVVRGGEKIDSIIYGMVL